MAEPTVALVGNPNTGKTTLFNALAGMNQRVGNYPGVTVETKKGKLRHGDLTFELIDLPGTYSLAPRSPDEMLAVDVILGHNARIAWGATNVGTTSTPRRRPCSRALRTKWPSVPIARREPGAARSIASHR